MPKASPAVIVALLIATSLFAPVSVSGIALLESNSVTATPAEGIAENTTNVLQVSTVEASGFGQTQTVVLDASAAQEAELDSEYSFARLRERLASAPNATVRNQIMENTTAAAAADAAELRQRERETRAAFVRGDMSAETYLQRLAVIHAEAEELIRFLGNPGTAPSVYSVSSDAEHRARAWGISEGLQMLTGPVRDRMAATVVGDAPPIEVHVAAGSSGFALSYIRADSTYVRETFRADNLDEDFSGGQNVSRLRNLVDVLYPGLQFISDFHFQSATLSPPHGSAYVVLSHPHGRVISYIDDSTEQVYYEVQRKQLDEMPVGYEFNRTENDTRVLVSKTYPGGPLQVTVLNVSDGNTTSRIDVPVTVNESTTYRTDDDGIAWFVSPAGDYNVTTTYNDTEFHFNVTA